MTKVVQNVEEGKNIFCGIDLHDQSMLAGIASGKGRIRYHSFNTREGKGVAQLISMLHGLESSHPGSKVWVSYEASGSGFRLADILEEEGFEISVLAPSNLPSSQKTKSNKTDKKDAKRVVDVLRAHVLAGNDLPRVWIPSLEIRDAREIVRRRVQLGEQMSSIKNRIHGMLKRNGLRKPDHIKTNWSDQHLLWLGQVAAELEYGACVSLLSLLREYQFFLSELGAVESELINLSRSTAYAKQVKSLVRLTGVGVMTAMVFLTELGDLSRFPNRRALGNYLGLTPRTYESGENDDRKGHISKMGPWRLRKLLNQASWVLVNKDDDWGEWFAERTGGKKDLRKKMITAVMRRLGIIMWHVALEVSD